MATINKPLHLVQTATDLDSVITVNAGHIQQVPKSALQQMFGSSGGGGGQIDTSHLQPKLVSGENIKTINGQSLLGSGNIAIASGGGSSSGIANGPNIIYLQGNTLASSSFTQANTIYVIRNSYTISGNVVIPAGCTLRFEGGSISGGTLTGDKTKIDAPKSRIFSGITIAGTWEVLDIYQDWFDFSSVQTFDNRKNFENLVALSSADVANNIYINPGTWTTSKKDGLLFLKSNTVFRNLGEIKVLPCNDRDGSIIVIKGKPGEYVHDVSVLGGIYTGDLAEHTLSVPGETDEHNHGIRIAGNSRNIRVDGVLTRRMHGDGLEVISEADNVHHVIFENCISDDNGRQGMSIETGQDIIVRNCTFKNTGKTKKISPGYGIDVEPWIDGVHVRNVVIEYCTFDNNAGGDISLLPNDKLTTEKGLYGGVVRHCRLKTLGVNNLNGMYIGNCDIADGGTISLLGVDGCVVENISKCVLSINQCKNIKVEYSKITNAFYDGAGSKLSSDILLQHCDVDGEMKVWGATKCKAYYCNIKNIQIGQMTDSEFENCVIDDVVAAQAVVRNVNVKRSHLRFTESKTMIGQVNYYDCDITFAQGQMILKGDGKEMARCRIKSNSSATAGIAAIGIAEENTSVTLIDNDFEGYSSLFYKNPTVANIKVRTDKFQVLNEYGHTFTPLAGCMELYNGIPRIYTGTKWINLATTA